MNEFVDGQQHGEAPSAAADGATERAHDAACPCCGGGGAAASPGAEEFRRRLREMMDRRRDQP